MERFNGNAAPERAPRSFDEYAEEYLAKMAALDKQIAEVAEKLSSNPGKLKETYEKILDSLKEEKTKLQEEYRIATQ